jgi:hypothetical protein
MFSKDSISDPDVGSPIVIRRGVDSNRVFSSQQDGDRDPTPWTA